MLPRILAVDFDGTLFENGYPGVGAPIVAPDGERLLDKVIRLQQQGWYIILWSCREGEPLLKATREAARHGLVFDAVNRNHPDAHLAFGLAANDRDRPRKVFAHRYLDDRALEPERFSELK